MRVTPGRVPDVLVLEPRVFGDDWGYFFESYNDRAFAEATGDSVRFVQDNQSGSSRGVLRGLHYQVRQAQGKLVRVIAGEILDLAVDIRRSSPTFGQWHAERLSADNRKQLWIPEGFAHGFCVVSQFAEVLYKASDFYAPEHERCIIWNDPELAIVWPSGLEPSLSDKDARGVPLREAEVFA